MTSLGSGKDGASSAVLAAGNSSERKGSTWMTHSRRWCNKPTSGGHIFQGNVTPVARLIEAQADPERHRDLLVRVGGYSARFTTLSRETRTRSSPGTATTT